MWCWASSSFFHLKSITVELEELKAHGTSSKLRVIHNSSYRKVSKIDVEPRKTLQSVLDPQRLCLIMKIKMLNKT